MTVWVLSQLIHAWQLCTIIIQPTATHMQIAGTNTQVDIPNRKRCPSEIEVQDLEQKEMPK